jgi:YD repeat-containing protein
MKAIYDPKSDTLSIELKSGPVAESDEDGPGVILDYDSDGNLVGIEVLDASKRVAETRTMQFQVVEKT